MNIAEMSLEELSREIDKSFAEKGIPPIELLIAFDKKHNEVDETQGATFTISVLNSKNEEVDKMEVKACYPERALLKAQDIFTEKHKNYRVVDAGMFLGSNTRDLCVVIDGTGNEESFQLIICG